MTHSENKNKKMLFFDSDDEEPNTCRLLQENRPSKVASLQNSETEKQFATVMPEVGKNGSLSSTVIRNLQLPKEIYRTNGNLRYDGDKTSVEILGGTKKNGYILNKKVSMSKMDSYMKDVKAYIEQLHSGTQNRVSKEDDLKIALSSVKSGNAIKAGDGSPVNIESDGKHEKILTARGSTQKEDFCMKEVKSVIDQVLIKVQESIIKEDKLTIAMSTKETNENVSFIFRPPVSTDKLQPQKEGLGNPMEGREDFLTKNNGRNTKERKFLDTKEMDIDIMNVEFYISQLLIDAQKKASKEDCLTNAMSEWDRGVSSTFTDSVQLPKDVCCENGMAIELDIGSPSENDKEIPDTTNKHLNLEDVKSYTEQLVINAQRRAIELDKLTIATSVTEIKPAVFDGNGNIFAAEQGFSTETIDDNCKHGNILDSQKIDLDIYRVNSCIEYSLKQVENVAYQEFQTTEIPVTGTKEKLHILKREVQLPKEGFVKYGNVTDNGDDASIENIGDYGPNIIAIKSSMLNIDSYMIGIKAYVAQVVNKAMERIVKEEDQTAEMLATENNGNINNGTDNRMQMRKDVYDVNGNAIGEAKRSSTEIDDDNENHWNKVTDLKIDFDARNVKSCVEQMLTEVENRTMEGDHTNQLKLVEEANGKNVPIFAETLQLPNMTKEVGGQNSNALHEADSTSMEKADNYKKNGNTINTKYNKYYTEQMLAEAKKKETKDYKLTISTSAGETNGNISAHSDTLPLQKDDCRQNVNAVEAGDGWTTECTSHNRKHPVNLYMSIKESDLKEVRHCIEHILTKVEESLTGKSKHITESNVKVTNGKTGSTFTEKLQLTEGYGETDNTFVAGDGFSVENAKRKDNCISAKSMFMPKMDNDIEHSKNRIEDLRRKSQKGVSKTNEVSAARPATRMTGSTSAHVSNDLESPNECYGENDNAIEEGYDTSTENPRNNVKYRNVAHKRNPEPNFYSDRNVIVSCVEQVITEVERRVCEKPVVGNVANIQGFYTFRSESTGTEKFGNTQETLESMSETRSDLKDLNQWIKHLLMEMVQKINLNSKVAKINPNSDNNCCGTASVDINFTSSFKLQEKISDAKENGQETDFDEAEIISCVEYLRFEVEKRLAEENKMKISDDDCSIMPTVSSTYMVNEANEKNLPILPCTRCMDANLTYFEYLSDEKFAFVAETANENITDKLGGNNLKKDASHDTSCVKIKEKRMKNFGTNKKNADLHDSTHSYQKFGYSAANDERFKLFNMKDIECCTENTFEAEKVEEIRLVIEDLDSHGDQKLSPDTRISDSEYNETHSLSPIEIPSFPRESQFKDNESLEAKKRNKDDIRYESNKKVIADESESPENEIDFDMLNVKFCMDSMLNEVSRRSFKENLQEMISNKMWEPRSENSVGENLHWSTSAFNTGMHSPQLGLKLNGLDFPSNKSTHQGRKTPETPRPCVPNKTEINKDEILLDSSRSTNHFIPSRGLKMPVDTFGENRPSDDVILSSPIKESLSSESVENTHLTYVGEKLSPSQYSLAYFEQFREWEECGYVPELPLRRPDLERVILHEVLEDSPWTKREFTPLLSPLTIDSSYIFSYESDEDSENEMPGFTEKSPNGGMKSNSSHSTDSAETDDQTMLSAIGLDVQEEKFKSESQVMFINHEINETKQHVPCIMDSTKSKQLPNELRNKFKVQATTQIPILPSKPRISKVNWKSEPSKLSDKKSLSRLIKLPSTPTIIATSASHIVKPTQTTPPVLVRPKEKKQKLEVDGIEKLKKILPKLGTDVEMKPSNWKNRSQCKVSKFGEIVTGFKDPVRTHNPIHDRLVQIQKIEDPSVEHSIVREHSLDHVKFKSRPAGLKTEVDLEKQKNNYPVSKNLPSYTEKIPRSSKDSKQECRQNPTAFFDSNQQIGQPIEFRQSEDQEKLSIPFSFDTDKSYHQVTTGDRALSNRSMPDSSRHVERQSTVTRVSPQRTGHQNIQNVPTKSIVIIDEQQVSASVVRPETTILSHRQAVNFTERVSRGRKSSSNRVRAGEQENVPNGKAKQKEQKDETKIKSRITKPMKRVDVSYLPPIRDKNASDEKTKENIQRRQNSKLSNKVDSIQNRPPWNASTKVRSESEDARLSRRKKIKTGSDKNKLEDPTRGSKLGKYKPLPDITKSDGTKVKGGGQLNDLLSKNSKLIGYSAFNKLSVLPSISTRISTKESCFDTRNTKKIVVNKGKENSLYDSGGITKVAECKDNDLFSLSEYKVQLNAGLNKEELITKGICRSSYAANKNENNSKTESCFTLPLSRLSDSGDSSDESTVSSVSSVSLGHFMQKSSPSISSALDSMSSSQTFRAPSAAKGKITLNSRLGKYSALIYKPVASNRNNKMFLGYHADSEDKYGNVRKLDESEVSTDSVIRIERAPCRHVDARVFNMFCMTPSLCSCSDHSSSVASSFQGVSVVRASDCGCIGRIKDKLCEKTTS